jgi:hypothetical protein
MNEQLQPCPFCGGTNTQVREKHMWTGMRNQLISAEVIHWCEKRGDQRLHSVIEVRDVTRESAVRLWNERTNG